jgi:hypothetical protein
MLENKSTSSFSGSRYPHEAKKLSHLKRELSHLTESDIKKRSGQRMQIAKGLRTVFKSKNCTKIAPWCAIFIVDLFFCKRLFAEIIPADQERALTNNKYESFSLL